MKPQTEQTLDYPKWVDNWIGQNDIGWWYYWEPDNNVNGPFKTKEDCVRALLADNSYGPTSTIRV